MAPSVDLSFASPAQDFQMPPTKRRRVKQHRVKHKQPLHPNNDLSNDEIRLLIARAITLAVSLAGFDEIDTVALEALGQKTEQYILELFTLVRRSMFGCRRTTPIPHDFATVLARKGPQLSTLIPNLKSPIPPDKCQPPFSTSSPVRADDTPLSALLGPSLVSKGEKERILVPWTLPTFPSKHTYSFTTVSTEREFDPRRTRELATTEGRLGEEALRRLAANTAMASVRAGENGHGKTGPRALSHQLWLETMHDFEKQGLFSRAEDGSSDGNGSRRPSTTEDDGRYEYGAIVNWEKHYWMKEDEPRKQSQQGEVKRTAEADQRDGDSVAGRT